MVRSPFPAPFAMAFAVALALGACGRTGARNPDCADSTCTDAGGAGSPSISSGGSARAGSAGTASSAGAGAATAAGAASTGGTDVGGANAGGPAAGGANEGGDASSPVVWSCLGGLGHRACYIDTIYTCGPDLSHQSAEVCAGTCTDDDSPVCVPPRCGETR